MRDTMADDKTVVFKLSIVRQFHIYMNILHILRICGVWSVAETDWELRTTHEALSHCLFQC